MKRFGMLAVALILVCALQGTALAVDYTSLEMTIDPKGLLTDDWLHDEESQAWFTSAMWLNYTLSVPEEDRAFDADLTSSSLKSFMFLTDGYVGLILNKPSSKELVMMYDPSDGTAIWTLMEMGASDDVEYLVKMTYLACWCRTDAKVRAEIYEQALELLSDETSGSGAE